MIRSRRHSLLLKRLREKRRFVQVLTGPRQVGKTTLARQVIDALHLPAHYASADEPTLRDRTWLDPQWVIGRLRAKEQKAGALRITGLLRRRGKTASTGAGLLNQPSVRTS